MSNEEYLPTFLTWNRSLKLTRFHSNTRFYILYFTIHIQKYTKPKTSSVASPFPASFAPSELFVPSHEIENGFSGLEKYSSKSTNTTFSTKWRKILRNLEELNHSRLVCCSIVKYQVFRKTPGCLPVAEKKVKNIAMKISRSSIIQFYIFSCT